MTRKDLYKRIKETIDEYGDTYITYDTGHEIGVKDGEGNHYTIKVGVDLQKKEIYSEEEQLMYTE